MEFKEMTAEELIEKRDALVAGLDAEDADLDAIENEVRAIKDELEARKAEAAQKAEIRKAVAEDKVPVEVIEKIENVEERKTMTNLEIRNTEDYINAFANYCKTGDDTECRSLLSDAANGTVPVPAFVEGIIAERVKASQILSRVRKTAAPGILKVGFEIDAPEADFHAEGGQAITEEDLSLGIVTMNPASFKKWVSFSDELMENSRAFVEYIYDEITRGIIKAEEKAVVQAILQAPQTATATAPAVAKTGSAASAITDIVDARALLSGAAEDIVVIVSPANYALYKGLQMAGTYGADPFDGHEVIISEFATAPIVGDLYGVTLNQPKGDAIEFKLDDKSLMTSDIVRLLGRQPAAVAVTGNLFFAKVSA